MCRGQVSSPGRTFITSWPPNDGSRASFVTMPHREIVMTQHEIPRRRPFCPSLLPTLFGFGGSQCYEGASKVIFSTLSSHAGSSHPRWCRLRRGVGFVSFCFCGLPVRVMPIPMECIFLTFHSYLEVVPSPRATRFGCGALFPKPGFSGRRSTFLLVGWKGCL